MIFFSSRCLRNFNLVSVCIVRVCCCACGCPMRACVFQGTFIGMWSSCTPFLSCFHSSFRVHPIAWVGCMHCARPYGCRCVLIFASRVRVRPLRDTLCACVALAKLLFLDAVVLQLNHMSMFDVLGTCLGLFCARKRKMSVPLRQSRCTQPLGGTAKLACTLRPPVAVVYS